MLFKRYESIEVDRRTLLYVPSETLWSTISDTYQVVETSTKMSTILETKSYKILRIVQSRIYRTFQMFQEACDIYNCANS